MLWVTMTIVYSSFSSLIRSSTASMEIGSSAEHGSSIKQHIGLHGDRADERDPSANIPSPIALATWDEARIKRLGRLLAVEARRRSMDVLLNIAWRGGRPVQSWMRFVVDPLIREALLPAPARHAGTSYSDRQ